MPLWYSGFPCLPMPQGMPRCGPPETQSALLFNSFQGSYGNIFRAMFRYSNLARFDRMAVLSVAPRSSGLHFHPTVIQKFIDNLLAVHAAFQ